MVFRAMMWRDPYCFQEYIYEFESRKEYKKCTQWSINCSICFLETHILSKRTKKNRYGFHIERFMKYDKCVSREAEKRLRHSVVFWKRWLNDHIQNSIAESFQLEHNLGVDIESHINVYL